MMVAGTVTDVTLSRTTQAHPLAAAYCRCGKSSPAFFRSCGRNVFVPVVKGFCRLQQEFFFFAARCSCSHRQWLSAGIEETFNTMELSR